MRDKLKFGVYFTQQFDMPNIGIGFVNWADEKYFHINLLFWEFAIGRTAR